MITLIRWFQIKAKETKYRLAFWRFVDGLFDEIAKQSAESEGSKKI